MLRALLAAIAALVIAAAPAGAHARHHARHHHHARHQLRRHAPAHRAQACSLAASEYEVQDGEAEVWSGGELVPLAEAEQLAIAEAETEAEQDACEARISAELLAEGEGPE